ncbi:MAG: UPF0280 family protein [Desulfobacterales bacterium]|nr:UPF0280 family protein [Desulfobacterales bacterium]
MEKYKERTYRNLIKKNDLIKYRVVVKETDLHVHSIIPLEDITRELVLEYRGYLENYIKRYPSFAKTLVPWEINEPVHIIVSEMSESSKKAGVGPMASVAGAIAEHVGYGILPYSPQVIVENGGDIFLKLDNPATVGIFAGDSPLSLHIGLKINSINKPMAVCTSSGKVGPSLSFGKADAVCVVSHSCSLADSCATAIGNMVKSKKDIDKAIRSGKNINGIIGIVIIIDDKLGAWGDLEIVPI